MSHEATTGTSYLWRTSQHIPLARPRTAQIGEVGWAVKDHADWSVANTGHQIKVGLRSEIKSTPNFYIHVGSLMQNTYVAITIN